ncbi:MAG: family 78 glycoside hydrolase catalytic domain [Phycisphaerales bacterium]|nr:MAG: family 78 glycoside hydrolase catalytic domain [Phycisphaerales bacterium]
MMRTFERSRHLTGFLIAALLCQAALAAPGAARNLTCEYLTNPLGIDEPFPRLAWQLNDPRRGAKQTAYQVLVATDSGLLSPGKANMWDSGRVHSGQSIQVVYAGKSLQPRTRYHWTVRTWDAAAEPSPFSPWAFWETGLLEPKDWRAQWIGLPERLPKSVAPHVGYHSQIAHSSDETKWVSIDLGRIRTVDTVRLFPCLPFSYSKNPGFLFPVRFRIEVSGDAEFKTGRTLVDRTGKDFPNPGDEVQTLGFEPTECRYVRMTVTKLAHRDADNYAFAVAEIQVLSEGTVISEGRQVKALDSIEQDDWSLRHLNDGVTQTQRRVESPAGPAHMLRCSFRLPTTIRCARAYVSALGVYELKINGRRVGDNILAPEWTDYHTRIQYQTYDITGLLCKGDNAVGAVIGDGWYAGLVGIAGRLHYGPRLGLLLQLEIECEDGSRHTIVSGPSWRGTTNGPIVASDIIRGETHDARKQQPGWDRPGFDDSKWRPVERIAGVKARLVAQVNEPIRITESLRPVRLTEPRPGVYVYDLGQNMVGWCRLVARGKAGETIQLHHGEMLDSDGTVYTKNLRGDYQKVTYICRDESEAVIEPHFTYQGFRYVQVKGLSRKPSLSDLTGCVIHSASPVTGRFECSEPMLNQLMRNILWTQRGNLHSTPTDCPQRNERCGWMGDAQIFSQAACFNMNMAAFYAKWLRDIRDAQGEGGRFSDFSPNQLKDSGKFLAAPGWADAGVIIPWRAYVNYGDVRALEKHYEVAKRWVEYVRSQSPDLIWVKGRGNDYGDWLNGDWLDLEGWSREGADTPREIFATAFFAHSTELLCKMARVLGKSGQAEQYAVLAGRIKEAFNAKYVQADGTIESDTQSVYALALHFDLIPDDMRPLAVKHIVRLIDRYKGHLSTGIQATNRLMLELVREGRTDLAYRLLLNRSAPSWGYMVDQGATTIWERWDGWIEGRGFQDPGMNSFNHFAFGAVGEWIFRHIAGINPDPERPGYKHVIIHPCPGGGLTWARAEYDSIHGTIRSSWKMSDDLFALDVTVPPNTSATVHVPLVGRSKDKKGKVKLDSTDSAKYLRDEAGFSVFAVSAGSYTFTVEH